MTDVQELMCANHFFSQKHQVVDDCMQEEHTRARINDWVGVISELYDSGLVRLANDIIDILHSENFELNGIRETLKVISACIPFL